MGVVGAVVGAADRVERRRRNSERARWGDWGVEMDMRVFRVIGIAVAMTGVAACGRSGSNDDLGRDLELAKSESGLTMAPTSGGTQVMSSVERMPVQAPVMAGSRSVTTIRHSTRPTAPVAPVASREEARSRAVADTVTVQVPRNGGGGDGSGADARPTPRGTPQQTEPRGGWRSVGDVIRNAPFPITP